VSAISPLASHWRTFRRFAFAPIAEVVLFDDVISKRQQCGRNFKTKGLGCLEVDHEFKSSWLFDRPIGWLRALQDTIRRSPGGAAVRDAAAEILAKIKRARAALDKAGAA
jgi:hypothetical protein